MSSFKFKDKDIFYLLEGDSSKPKLLILNGIMMSTKSWDPFMKTWLEHFQVLRVDFLDQGQTDKMEDNFKQSLQVELLIALLDHLSIDKINLVGISYGGAVALAFATQYESRINRLILFNSNAYTNPLLKDIGRSWIKAGQTRDGSLYYKTTIPIIYSPSYYEDKIEWMKNREKVLTPIFSDPKFLDSMERLTLSAESFDVRKKLESLALDTMIITAEEDFLTPRKDQEYLAKHIKNAHWITLPGIGHASMYENPLLFASLITGFCLVKTNQFDI
ncbi:alpha/beta hydrolase [Mycoplasmatota bacterium]|nr:alpha/beta hydrolase [Mycoplasmatota bacterium]